MADLIQSPFTRQQYNTTAGYGNPIFIGDIVAANQMVLTMLAALAGLDATTDFAIFSGFAYTPGSPGQYGPGYFYLNGVWYYQPTAFNENLRLIPNITGTLPYSYPDDSVTHNRYNINYSQTGTGGTETPVFATGGDMDIYRLDNKVTRKATILANEQQATLGATYTVTFENDKAVFFAAASVDTEIDFDLTGAIPGSVVTLKWAWGAGRTLTFGTGSYDLIQEGGDLGEVSSNTNILNIMYVGINESGNAEIRYVINQAM